MAIKHDQVDPASEFFRGSEIEKRKELLLLLNSWKAAISMADPIVFHGDGKKYAAADYFGSDGFMPGYFSRRPRIVFVGRESRGNSGNDGVFEDITFLNSSKGDKIGSGSFWRRILYLVEGIRSEGKIAFEELPEASEIAESMTKDENYGFSKINISKYSNDRSDGGSADTKLIRRFLADSSRGGRNFLREELELLDPDIIITMNLWNGIADEQYLDSCFSRKDLVAKIEDKADLWKFTLNGRSVKLLDMWHFSKPGSDSENYYEPAMKLLFRVG